MDDTRVDRWLWAVRLFKTRSAASDGCRGGLVKINGTSAKAASPVHVGDRIEARIHDRARDVVVARLISKRVSAPIASECYIDHSPPPPNDYPRRLFPRLPGAGRPTKRDRRLIDRLRGQ